MTTIVKSVMDLTRKLIGLTETKVISIKENADSKPHEVEIQFDFSKVTIEWLKAKAMRTIVIDQQRKLRELGTEYIKSHPKMNVLLEPVTKKQSLTPKESIMKLSGKLSQKELQEMIKELKSRK